MMSYTLVVTLVHVANGEAAVSIVTSVHKTVALGTLVRPLGHIIQGLR